MSATARHLREARSSQRDLKVVRRRGRQLIRRTGSRRSVPLAIAAGVAVIAVVAAVLLSQVVLAQSAFKLEAINKRLAAAEDRREELLAEVAALESPGRIERYARARLGMVDPSRVEYIVARVRTGEDNRLADALRQKDLPLPGDSTAIGLEP